MALNYIVPQYMKHFECIGSDCEYTCCSGWSITVNQAKYKTIKKLMDSSKAQREKFRASFQRIRKPLSSENDYAMLALTDERRCSQLNEDNLCNLYCDFGEATLPYTCATYPRTINYMVGERVELSASLSCPEAARLCLFKDDAMSLTNSDDSILPSKKISPFRTLHPEQHTQYSRYLDSVRSFIIEQLGNTSYPLRTRLFMVTYFCEHTKERYHYNSHEDPTNALAELIDQLSASSMQDALHDQFSQLEIPQQIGLLLVSIISIHPAEGHQNDDYRNLLTRITQHHLPETADTLVLDQEEQQQQLWQIYGQRKAVLEQHFTDTLDLAFTNYCANYWFKEWYTSEKDLTVHQRKLLIRVALLRFLIYCHPSLDTIVHKNEAPSTEEQQQLEKVIIEVVTMTSRALDHNRSSIQNIEDRLNEFNMNSLAHIMLLIDV